jgi:hypothetical protein
MSKSKPAKVTVAPGEGRTVTLRDGRDIKESIELDYTPEVAKRMLDGDLIESKKEHLPAEPRKKVSE